MRKLAVNLAILILALGLSSGCTTNPITGRSQVMMVSDAEAAQASQKAYAQLLAEARQQRALDNSPQNLDRIRGITQRLVAQAIQFRPETRNWKWEVHVLKSDEVNAWCMAGGKMAVYTGLLAKIKPTDDELAQVMAHEISHALLSHQAEKMSRAQMQQTGLQLGVLAGALAGYNLQGVASLANTVATVGLELPNSREAEAEADKVGMELAARAAYDPRASAALWEKMLNVGGSGTPEWLSTHPSPETRLQTVRALAEKLMPVYERALRQQ